MWMSTDSGCRSPRLVLLFIRHVEIDLVPRNNADHQVISRTVSDARRRLQVRKEPRPKNTCRASGVEWRQPQWRHRSFKQQWLPHLLANRRIHNRNERAETAGPNKPLWNSGITAAEIVCDHSGCEAERRMQGPTRLPSAATRRRPHPDYQPLLVGDVRQNSTHRNAGRPGARPVALVAGQQSHSRLLRKLLAEQGADQATRDSRPGRCAASSPSFTSAGKIARRQARIEEAMKTRWSGDWHILKHLLHTNEPLFIRRQSQSLADTRTGTVCTN